MQRLRVVFASHGPWVLLGVLGGLVLLGVAWVFQTPASLAQRRAPVGVGTPVPAPTLSWNYAASAPEHFVVRRSIDGGTWQDVAVLPGATGTGLTWQDTTLPASAAPFVAQYVLYAVAEGNVWSETSNRAIATFGGSPRVPSDKVAIVRADSAESQAAKHPARLAGDGAPTTFWHTKWSGTPAKLPHWIVLDLGAVLPVDGLAYLPRQDGSAQGRITAYEVHVSQDNTTWSEPVAVGAWVWYERPLEQYVRWGTVDARYVRLKALSEASGGPWTAAAEIGLYAGTPAPVGVALGECVAVQESPKVSTIRCTLP